MPVALNNSENGVSKHQITAPRTLESIPPPPPPPGHYIRSGRGSEVYGISGTYVIDVIISSKKIPEACTYESARLAKTERFNEHSSARLFAFFIPPKSPSQLCGWPRESRESPPPRMGNSWVGGGGNRIRTEEGSKAGQS